MSGGDAPHSPLCWATLAERADRSADFHRVRKQTGMEPGEGAEGHTLPHRGLRLPGGLTGAAPPPLLQPTPALAFTLEN